MANFYDPNAKGLDLNITNITIGVVLSLILIQAFGLLIGNALGFSIKLGPIFVLLPIAISSLMAVAIVKNLLNGKEVSKQDVFAIVVVATLSLLVLMFLRDFVPEIFVQSLVGLQSMVGL